MNNSGKIEETSNEKKLPKYNAQSIKMMTPAEKHGACMRLAEFAIKLNERQRATRWKITIGIWSLIISATAGLIYLQREINIDIWIGVIVVGVHALWLWVMSRYEEQQYMFAEFYRKQAECILLNHKHALPELGSEYVESEWRRDTKATFKFFFGHGIYIQILVTIILVILSYCIRSV